MIPFLNIKATTAAVVFAATFGMSAALTRAQMVWPELRGITGGSVGDTWDRFTAWLSGLFGG